MADLRFESMSRRMRELADARALEAEMDAGDCTCTACTAKLGDFGVARDATQIDADRSGEGQGAACDWCAHPFNGHLAVSDDQHGGLYCSVECCHEGRATRIMAARLATAK